MAARVWRRHAAAGAVVMLVCSLERSPSAQGPDYRALVDAYAEGRTQEAVGAIAAWPEPRIRSAVRTLGEQPGLDRARAAAMLHTEAALAVGSERRYLTHLDAARSLVDGISGDDRASVFTRRWYAWAVALRVARNDTYRARQELARAVGKDSDNKELWLASGIVMEMGIRNTEHNLRGLWNEENRRLDQQLQAAVAAYRRAVAMDPTYLEARLRLGWALFLSDSQRSARAELDHVAARAARADLRYLAHLFLAAVAERERRVDDALREYEAAHAAGPHQASFVALMRLEQARGHGDRARSLAADFAALPARDDDPLRYYDSGITSGELLEWLRGEARKR